MLIACQRSNVCEGVAFWWCERSRYAALNARATGKQSSLRLKPVFFIEKTKWFRWVTWGMLLYTVTGIWMHHMLFILSHKSTTRLLYSSLYPTYRANLTFSFICLSFQQPLYISCWPHFFKPKTSPRSLSVSLFLSLSIFLKQRLLQDHWSFQKSLLRHWTEQLYIYLCTMEMNAHCLYLHEQTFKTLTLDFKKKIFIYFCVTGK